MSASRSILYPVKADNPGKLILVTQHVQGAGTSNPVVVDGNTPGVTVTRTGVGVYLATFDDKYPALLGACCCLQADTPGDLAGHTVVFDSYTAATSTAAASIAFSLFDAAEAPHDLASAEFFYLEFKFKDKNI